MKNSVRQSTLIQSAFSGQWYPNEDAAKSFSSKINEYNPSITNLRSWQEECAFSLMGDNSNRMIIAPTGSGKSIAVSYMVSHMIHHCMVEKAIISVPQKAIGGGFVKPLMFAMDKEGKDVFDYVIKHDYCNDDQDESKIDSVIKFLEDNYLVANSDRILVCVNAYRVHI